MSLGPNFFNRFHKMSNQRQLIEVKQMMQTPEWKVFVQHVETLRAAYTNEVLAPVESEKDIYSCERAKGAEIVLRCLLPDFTSWLDSEIGKQQD